MNRRWLVRERRYEVVKAVGLDSMPCFHPAESVMVAGLDSDCGCHLRTEE